MVLPSTFNLFLGGQEYIRLHQSGAYNFIPTVDILFFLLYYIDIALFHSHERGSNVITGLPFACDS